MTNPLFADEDSRWNALVQREPASQGAFFYAVKTTGVVCRPGCASRLPKKENVVFFDTYEEAVQAGYRPCKRCCPDLDSPNEHHVQAVIQACRRIEERENPPTLRQLAAEAGLSPWYFHRIFKQIVGITPKQYTAAWQTQRFRESLRDGRSVTEAVYEAGFQSSSRAYETTHERLGMPPSTYKRGGAGLQIRYGIASCSLGWVVVATTRRGICLIEFGDTPESLPAKVKEHFSEADLEEAGADFSALLHEVVALIEEPGCAVDLPLDIQGTAFQEQVWRALREIAPGTTVSYAELARRIGRPEASRAVAQACAANKLAVAVPCHRVVRSDGGLGGYRWGLERKEALLRREREQVEARQAI